MRTATHDQSEIVHLNRLGVRFLIDGDETGGRFSVVEYQLPPRALGAPPHTHSEEEEYSFVFEGRVGLQLADEVFEAGPGELVVKRRGLEHAFWNAGDEPARILELISPAGFENYFRDLAPLLAAHDQPAIAAVVARYGLTIDHTSIPAFIERHGLRAAGPDTEE